MPIVNPRVPGRVGQRPVRFMKPSGKYVTGYVTAVGSGSGFKVWFLHRHTANKVTDNVAVRTTGHGQAGRLDARLK